MQKDCRDGRTVIDPMRKAAISVTDVTVIEAPAWLNIKPIRSGMSTSLNWIFRQQAIITNMSSTPRPINKKGKDVCIGPYLTPIREQIPQAQTKAMPTLKSPMLPSIN